MAPPRPNKGMTANPMRPGRYRPGKVIADDASSDEEEGDDDEEQQESADVTNKSKPQSAPKAPPPKATSFPKGAVVAAAHLKDLDMNERRRRDSAREKERIDDERRERERREREAGFITESSEGSDSGDEEDVDDDQGGVSIAPSRSQPQQCQQSTTQADQESEESGSDSDEDSSDSSDSDAKRRLMKRPVFMKKDARPATNGDASSASVMASQQAMQKEAEAEAARKLATSNALIQARIDAEAAAKVANSRAWDEVDLTGEDGELDDTDGLDPELERTQWIARELARVKRSRAALEEKEAEIAEVERRRALETPEREEEDRQIIEAQKKEKDGKGKAGFMAQYHHKGAFFSDAVDKEGKKLAERDLMGAEYENNVGVMEALPKYLQVRDQTTIGRKGRQRHKDLKSEDTGRWGDIGGDQRGGGRNGGNDSRSMYGTDERYRPDRPGDGATGANSMDVGDRGRKRPGEAGSREDYKRPRIEERS